MAVQVIQIPWTSDLEPQLSRALGEYLPDIREEVAQGTCQLFQVGECLAVTRCEGTRTGRELVGVALVGHNAKAAVKAIERIAIANHCDTARIHCQNPAIARLYRQTGQDWHEVERVYRLDLTEVKHGRTQ
ncbi:hypothetical protein [Celerinatantimonas sp. MCCC 1A17872]|uniref:hypothetical protein n=1 Tax=Celerinatantimonas sp. MCCC 1A17872 TaxID=3177514 RepID=UPI0038C4A8BE